MYLFHMTNINSLKNILMDGELKSASLTENLDWGDGLYEAKNKKFVFFSVVDKIEKDLAGMIGVVLYFDYNLLYNRTYYISTVWSSTPNELGKLNTNGGKEYKLKYPQYYKKTKNVLKKLYDKSVLKNSKSFFIFQQVAIKNKVNLKYLKCIEFGSKVKPSNIILKILKKEYPDVEIRYSKSKISST